MEGSGIDLNLNQQPLDQPVDSLSRLGMLPNEYDHLETVNDSIAERFRQLKAATSRAGLNPNWRSMRNSNQTGCASTAPVVDVNNGRGRNNGEESGGVMERNVERWKGCKRESSLLVAMALEMDSEFRNVTETGGSFYDCNLCLYVAREPILTCCGHLFCWACFYSLPYVYSNAKECPVCEGEVTDSNIVPIYGNGDSIRESKLEASMMIPPRPKAQRVESVRKPRMTRGVSNIPVAEALRRVRSTITAMRDQSQHEESSSITLDSGNISSESIREAVQRIRPYAQLFSLPSAFDNAEMMVTDLEAYIANHQLQRSNAQPIVSGDGDSLNRNAAVSQSEHQMSSEGINSAVPGRSSSGTAAVFNGIGQTENLATDTPTDVNLPPHRFSSASR